MKGDERRSSAYRATVVGIVGNGALFAVKGGAAVVTGSIALLSDAFNSLVDVVSAIAIAYSVHVAHREPDEDHPYGHRRAEPIAALTVAIFTAILGFSVARAALGRIMSGPEPIREVELALGALLFSMVGNLLLARHMRRRGEEIESPAILAVAVESENDIWTSLAALAGVIGATLGWPLFDSVAGLAVGAWIVWGGYRFGRRNIDYLMGKSPPRPLLKAIREASLAVGGVDGVHDVRAHHVGHRIHVEVHIEVDQELSTRRSHDVGGSVRRAIEGLPAIDRAFVHIDPVLESTYVIATLARALHGKSEIYAGFAQSFADRPGLAGLWQAMATDALAWAERLGVVQRLKAAGWHFDDHEIDGKAADLLLECVTRARSGLGAGAPDAATAIGIAAELEADSGRRLAECAATPADPAVEASLAGASPPPPSVEVLRQRLAPALEAVTGDEHAIAGLVELQKLLAPRK